MEPAQEIFRNSFSLNSSISPPGFTAPWHWHEINEIYICETEKMHYLVGNILYEMKRGDILLFNSLDVHRALPPETGNYARKTILFQDNFLQNWNTSEYDLFACFHYRKPEFCHYRSLETEDYEKLLILFNKGMKTAKSKHPASLLKQRMILTEILIFLNEIYAVPVDRKDHLKRLSEEDFIQDVLSFIEEQIRDDIRLPQLSREFGISVNSLNSKFKKVTRMTVHQFIIQRRLQLACILLKQGNSVSDSAYDSGFGDLSHFIRCFKANIGTTPRNYALGKSTKAAFPEN
jgi:AraC-like DNA-binding protein